MRRRSVRLAAWLLIAAGAGLGAWGAWRWAAGDAGGTPAARAVPRGERSLLLVTVDTTRPDRLEPYGSETVATPHLAALAAQGVTFEQAFAVAPITLVAHTSILSGLDPPRHGVRNNGLHYVPDDVETLAERLAARGWATAAFVSAAVLDRRYGLDQGFEVYDDDLSAGRERHPRMVADRPAEATVAAASSWLDALARDERFFLWVHLYDPHAAYSPPPPWRDRYAGRLYDGEIAYMDAQLGVLLAHPRIDEETLVSVIGDHGESLGEHGEQTHALLAYDSTLHVPWIVRVPGGPRGLRVRSTVGQVDLVPTVLDLLGQRPPADGDGASLVPLLAGRADGEPSRALYSETFLPFYTYGWAELTVLRQGRFKWIEAPRPELYDTRRDPRELANLAAQEPGLAHDLSRDLAARRRAAGDADDRASELELDSEARERLRSLGYLAVGSGRRDVERERPDPKAMIDLHVGLERARFLSRDRLFAAAERELTAVLRRDPGNLAALMDLADAVAEQQRWDEAVSILERALARDPAYPQIHLRMAGVEARRGDLERAVELADLALGVDPRLLEARLRKAAYLSRLRHPAAAREELETALAADPGSPAANVLYARLVELRRDPAAAEARVRAALGRDPFQVAAWQLLGDILEAAGRPDEALAAWRSGLERQPDDADLHARLGGALARRGDAAAEAEAHLREALRLTAEPRPDVEVTLGALLADGGRLDEALALYERVLSDEPDHPAARNNRAIALYRSGRLDAAAAELATLVAVHPRHADAHNNLAAVALDQGRAADAELHARRALDLAPRMPEGWNNLGLARVAQGDDATARRHFEHAVELAPDYWQADLNLGQTLARQAAGDATAARRAADVFESLVQRRPQLAEPHLALGHLYAGPLADPGRARTHYNAYLRHAPGGEQAAAVRRRLAELGR